jgi:3-phenylpropionate/trans-cinnamate dioxygenase ferredoxin reductase subunit
MADGSVIDADIVITGIGIVPNIELAQAAGLTLDNGIVVNDVGQTSDAHIYAAGDCTQHPNDVLGRKLRLESVPNAIEQGKAVASAICGAPKPYHQVPWFWSDQYDVKLQIAGVPTQIDQKVLRGDDTSNSFAWFYFTSDKLTGVTAVNRPAEFMAGRMLIEKSAKGEASIDMDALADEGVKPKSWMQ